MKIIQNNYENPIVVEDEVISMVCEECNSVFEIEEQDCHIGQYGTAFVNCPCCGYENIVEDYSINLNKNNLDFPIHYSHFATKKEGTVFIDNKEINNWIKESISWLEKHPQEHFRYRGTGDTFTVVFNHDDEYWIVVTKDYYETSIDK